MNTFISLKTSFEMNFLLVELSREQDKIVFSGGNFGAILLPLKTHVVTEATSVQ